jgi:hypothetical protein
VILEADDARLDRAELSMHGLKIATEVSHHGAVIAPLGFHLDTEILGRPVRLGGRSQARSASRTQVSCRALGLQAYLADCAIGLDENPGGRCGNHAIIRPMQAA